MTHSFRTIVDQQLQAHRTREATQAEAWTEAVRELGEACAEFDAAIAPARLFLRDPGGDGPVCLSKPCGFDVVLESPGAVRRSWLGQVVWLASEKQWYRCTGAFPIPLRRTVYFDTFAQVLEFFVGEDSFGKALAEIQAATPCTFSPSPVTRISDDLVIVQPKPVVASNVRRIVAAALAVAGALALWWCGA